MKVPTQSQTLVRINPGVGAHRLLGLGNQSKKMCHANEGEFESRAR
jgi:hypothetical protein